MAARKRLRSALKTRERIRTGMLTNRLQDHVFGRCEMMPTQVKAALAVLRKPCLILSPQGRAGIIALAGVWRLELKAEAERIIASPSARLTPEPSNANRRCTSELLRVLPHDYRS